MGRSYWFECSKCGYRAKVAGRADRGLNCAVQTILCRDCKQLFDAVTRLRVADETPGGNGSKTDFPLNRWRLNSNRQSCAASRRSPPRFEAVLNRLPLRDIKQSKWLQFKLQCPVSPIHRVQAWDFPDKCPKCGIFLEKNALPYRIWD
jgi:hypothetical protein